MYQLEDEAKKGEFDLVLSKEENMNQAGLVSSVLEGRCTLMPYVFRGLCEKKKRGSEGNGQAGISILPNGRWALVDPRIC